MQPSTDNSTLMFIIASLLISFIVIQLYLIVKFKNFTNKIIRIVSNLDLMIRELQWNQTSVKSIKMKSCQNCKNRVVFFHSEQDPYFYIKCRLKNKPVNPEDCCKNFILDPQNYEI